MGWSREVQAAPCEAACSHSRSWPGELCMGPSYVRTLLVNFATCPGMGGCPSPALLWPSGWFRLAQLQVLDWAGGLSRKKRYILLCAACIWLTIKAFPSVQKLSGLHGNFYLGQSPSETHVTLHAWSHSHKQSLPGRLQG